MWKVYEQLVGSFRAHDGRNVRRRHGRAAIMGCRSGEPSSGCFWLGKSGWLGSWRRGGAHLLVFWGRDSCAAGRRGHPLPGLGLPPPISVSREEKEEEGAQGARGKGRGPTLVLRSRLTAGAWSCCPAGENYSFRTPIVALRIFAISNIDIVKLGLQTSVS